MSRSKCGKSGAGETSIDFLAMGSRAVGVAEYRINSREAARSKPVEMMWVGEAHVRRTGRGESWDAQVTIEEGERGSRRWICFVLVESATREPAGDHAEEEIYSVQELG